MIKKRIKRALRAIGLVKPHNSTKAKLMAGGAPDLVAARSIVRALYRTILRREADAEGCEGFANSLASGAVSQVDVVRALMESPEFATAYARHPNVSNALSTALVDGLLQQHGGPAADSCKAGLAAGFPVGEMVKELCRSPEFRNMSLVFAVHPEAAAGIAGSMISALTGRESPDAESSNFGRALASGYPVKAFIEEVCQSPEFRTTWAVGYSALQGRPAVPSEIGQLAEQLIAARLIGDGGILGLPPVNALNRPPVSVKQVAAMIRTLDMLADRPMA